MIRRDYIERLVQQSVQALAQVFDLVAAGQFDPALEMIRRTAETVLGPLAKLADRLDPATAVALVGKYEVERIRVYAALVGEEALIHDLRKRPAEAAATGRLAL